MIFCRVQISVRPYAVEKGSIVLGFTASLAFFSEYMDQDGFLIVSGETENLLHLLYVVAVERTPVVDAHFFKYICGKDQGFQFGFDLF